MVSKNFLWSFRSCFCPSSRHNIQRVELMRLNRSLISKPLFSSYFPSGVLSSFYLGRLEMSSCIELYHLKLKESPHLEYMALEWFIAGDYRSRDPGCITSMRQRLNLPTLASRRQVLKLSSFFKVVEGLVPGLPIENFLVRARPKRNIKIKQYKDHQTQNILESR